MDDERIVTLLREIDRSNWRILEELEAIRQAVERKEEKDGCKTGDTGSAR